jgi:glycosyltransferase involved in cell wall biosynthesis
VVPVSEHAAVQVRRLERTPQGRVVVIPNGIELPSPPKRGTRPVRYGISVARLDPIKDQASLLRAVRRIVDKVPDFKLELVGEGAERPRLERLRDELGLRAHVLLSGHCDDVALRLARADVFFLTSLSEGLPLSLLEAMASALPVIATDVGGNREVVVQGETGLLVPAGSAEEVAEAALSLVREPHRAGALGLAGRARVESLFSLEGMIARYERLYRSRLAPRHRRWVPAAREV